SPNLTFSARTVAPRRDRCAETCIRRTATSPAPLVPNSATAAHPSRPSRHESRTLAKEKSWDDGAPCPALSRTPCCGLAMALQHLPHPAGFPFVETTSLR